MKKLTLLFLLFIPIYSFSIPVRKQFTINRCTNKPKIDAILDDEVWKTAATTEDFIQNNPNNGALPTEKTQLKLAYDDDAIYLAAVLFDSHPDSILTEFGLRDAGDELNADLFSIEINPYNDGRSSFEFMTSASGIQMDSQNTIEAMNKSWNAVWESRTRITDFGWVVEMRIPYSAIRFPKKDVQLWEMNIFRLIKRKNEAITWNFVNKEVTGWLNQAGELHGLQGINPATRLSFTPYLTSYMEKAADENKFTSKFKGGMDVKLGLNESFTLDMMLIPDFGQVKTDDKSLNLTPFETYYNENRSFFTEGTQIFNKGNIFYSRRLGSKPSNYDNIRNLLKPGEYITENPIETQLLNASKISGRTSNGLGIGFINAMSANTFATIRDSATGQTHKICTQPFTNYNMMVLDQSLGNQSFISFANSNKYSPNNANLANVTATEFKFTNKNEEFALSGNGAMSHLNNNAAVSNGFRYQLQMAKIKGKFQFEINSLVLDNKFNPNDMGYLESNNKIISYAKFACNFYKPFSIFNQWENTVIFNYKRIYKPSRYSNFDIYGMVKPTFRDFSYLTLEIDVTPTNKYDYNEPRVDGWKYEEPSDYYLSLTHGSDGRKMLSTITRVAYWQGATFNKSAYWVNFTPKIRFSDKLSISLSSVYELYINSLGYSGKATDNSEVYFVNRDNTVVINTIKWRWMLNQYHSIELNVRHYWSEVKNKECYKLNPNGSLNGNTTHTNPNHINYNAFNFYFTYNWEFSPGSQLSIVWKNDTEKSDQLINRKYVNNLNSTLENSMNSSISLRLYYYIDYQTLRNKSKKTSFNGKE